MAITGLWVEFPKWYNRRRESDESLPTLDALDYAERQVLFDEFRAENPTLCQA